MFTTIGADQWFWYVTGALGPALRLEIPEPDDLTAQEPTPALAA